MEEHLIMSQEVRFNCRMESSFPVGLPPPACLALNKLPSRIDHHHLPLPSLTQPFPFSHILSLFLPTPMWLDSFPLFGSCFPPHSFQKCPPPHINKTVPAFSLDILSPSSHKGRRGCSGLSCVPFRSLPFLLNCPDETKPDVQYFKR